ncbi:protein of unknown function [Agrobacterium pusense]|uniref:Uncharacterized protein n=1 Tax=Agrobacterium pusense TaxID=648995 RepID=U4PXI3_9HYPH|nr:protein of unknown function [Agrobacterium pusense]
MRLTFKRFLSRNVMLRPRLKQIIDLRLFLWYTNNTDPQRGICVPKNTTKATPLLHAVSVTYRAFTLSNPARREGVFLRARLDQCGIT